jgi:NAD(P)-dependent dehydrogenase (short-subunit alcohol dehydrogenase family)
LDVVGEDCTPGWRVRSYGESMTASFQSALIVGAGMGLSAALARRLVHSGCSVALAARNIGKLESLCAETGAAAFPCDAQDPAEVTKLFDAVGRFAGPPDVVIYNASARVRGPFTTLAPDDVRRALMVGAFGAFLVAQRAVPAMLEKGRGAILFTGASASVKGYAESAPFAMAKFALRGLAQSMARELAPKGIHVAHFVIDGAIRPRGRDDNDDSTLDPDAIAQTYMNVLMQPRSAWTWEVEVRPWVERF